MDRAVAEILAAEPNTVLRLHPGAPSGLSFFCLYHYPPPPHTLSTPSSRVFYWPFPQGLAQGPIALFRHELPLMEDILEYLFGLVKQHNGYQEECGLARGSTGSLSTLLFLKVVRT